MGRDKLKKKEYDKTRYERIKNVDKNFLKSIAEKRKDWRAKNPKKNCETQKRWKLAHPEQVKDMNRDWCYRTKYGISLVQYNELLKRQNNVCLLCGNETAYRTKGRNLFVDHNHKNKEIRGLLCSRCNTMIGQIETVGITKIIEYLHK